LKQENSDGNQMARPWTPLIKFKGPRSLLKRSMVKPLLTQVPARFKPLQLSVKEMEAVEVSLLHNCKEWWCLTDGLI